MAAIILQTDFDIDKDSSLEIKGMEDKNSLAYILYELSFLKNINQIINRLNQISNKRSKAKNTKGMKEGNAPLAPDNLSIEINRIYEKIKAKYNTKIDVTRNLMEAQNWKPKESDYFRYFQYWMRRYAETLMKESKA